MEFQRYAIYYTPPAGSELATRGAQWLGWDVDAGCAADQPTIGGLPRPLAEITETPRKYGMHGTLKPPFRLAHGQSYDTFLTAATDIAAAMAPVNLGMLRVRALGPFLALIPEVQTPALETVAARVVTALDMFRAPLNAAEMARRRATPLTPQQDMLLRQWGYPYVLDEFRFHVTCTGKLSDAEVVPIRAAVQDWMAPATGTPQMMTDLSVFGEDTDGAFHLITRLPLGR
nr:DUF1045 domain-containing protein [Roseicitreum antarcticum]